MRTGVGVRERAERFVWGLLQETPHTQGRCREARGGSGGASSAILSLLWESGLVPASL